MPTSTTAGCCPKLSKHGFGRTVHAAAPPSISFMLPDSGHIQESEVERLNRRNRRREPIYTRADAGNLMRQIEGHAYERWFEPGPEVRARFWNAGHILGSASIEVRIDDGGGLVHLLFSSDLGPNEKVFHLEPAARAPTVIATAPMRPSRSGGRSAARSTTRWPRAAIF